MSTPVETNQAKRLLTDRVMLWVSALALSAVTGLAQPANGNGEQMAFKEAVTEASRCAYNEYLANWPNGEHAEIVRQGRAEVELFEKAWREDSEDLFRQCTRQFPSGLLTRRARLATTQIADFLVAQKQDRREAYQAFLAKHHEGDYVELARRLLLVQLIRDHDLMALQRFIAENPKSSLVPQARLALEEMAFGDLCADPSPEGIEQYLRQFPASRFRTECEEARRIATQAQDALRDAAYASQFLAGNPTSIWSAAVRKRLFGPVRLGLFVAYKEEKPSRERMAADGYLGFAEFVLAWIKLRDAAQQAGDLQHGEPPDLSDLRRLGFGVRTQGEPPSAKEVNQSVGAISWCTTAYEHTKYNVWDTLAMDIYHVVTLKCPTAPDANKEWVFRARYRGSAQGAAQEFLDGLPEFYRRVRRELPLALDECLRRAQSLGHARVLE